MIMNIKRTCMAATAAMLVSISAAAAPLRLPGSNTVLGGAMVYNDLWGQVDDKGNYNNPITAGIYTIQAKPGGEIKSVYRNENMLKMRAGVKVNSIYYTISTANYDQEAYLATYYANSWSQRSSDEIDVVNVPSDMTYDPVSGNVYGFFYNDQTQEYDRFCRFDTYYGEAELIATVDRNAFAIAANSKGEIYGIWGWTGWLIKVDPQTGRYQQIGKTGFAPALINSMTFDDATGKLYWCANDAAGYSALMEVDTTTGAATEIMHFKDNASFAGIFAMPYTIPNSAPASVTDAKVNFSAPGALTGKVSFNAPTKTHNGGALSGKLTIVVTVNGSNPIEISGVEPGAFVETDEIVFPEGAVTVEILSADDVNQGEIVTLQTWAGEDIPGAPTDVALRDVESVPTLSWTAPTQGMNGGVFDAAGLSYTVVRYPDKETFSGITSNTWSDTGFSGNSAIYYEVYAVNAKGQSPAAKSPTMVFGEGYTVPFTEAFSSKEDFSLWTVQDLNGGTTWQWDKSGRNIYYEYGMEVEKEGDDWIFSPKIKLEKDVMYALTFDSKTFYAGYPENFRFMLGKEPNPAAMSQTLTEVTDYEMPAKAETRRVLFSVDESGYYHLGLYCFSIAHNWRLTIDNISMAEVDGNVPASVSDLKVTPAGKGALSAVISCKAPTLDSRGKELHDSMSVSLYRNQEESPLHVFADVAPGAELSWTDDSMTESDVYSYSAVASNDAGEGVAARTSAFIGMDIPGAVTDLRAVEDAEGIVTLSWNAPAVGAHGGYFNPEGMTYRIVRSLDAKTLAEACTETAFVDNTLDLRAQNLFYYLVTPYVGETKGQYANTDLNGVFGPAIVAPMTETFPNASISNYPWLSESDGSVYLWSLETQGIGPDTSDQNGDDGLVMMYSTELSAGITGDFSSPKVDISALENPALTFWFYHSQLDGENPDDSERMTVAVMADGGAFIPVEGFEVARNDGSTGWKRHALDLKPYKDSRYIRVLFRAQSKGLANLMLDNIVIADIQATDVEASALEGPIRVAKGLPIEYSVTVSNSGSDAAQGVAVALSFAGVELAKASVGTLAPGEMKTVPMTVSFAANGKGNLVMTVSADSDARDDNNSSLLAVEVVDPVIPAPAGLTAVPFNGNVHLEWLDPYDRAAFTDDLESYEDWAIKGFGGYVMVDRDRANTYYISKDLDEYPNMVVPKAFQICNARKLGIDVWNQGKPHSDDRMLMCIAAQDVPNDDWLISPQLNGGAHTVSFWAKSFTTDETPAERMRVLYSNGSTNPDDFVPLHTAGYIEVPEMWAEYSFVLPEGAKRFAINCVSENAFALFVDDISFNDMTVADLDVLGYEIFRNETPLKSDLKENGYVDDSAPVEEALTYKVRALYGDILSDFSESVEVRLSGVGAAGEDVTVRIISGPGYIDILDAAGRQAAVASPAGQLYFSGILEEDSFRLTLPSGLYIVNVEGRPAKLLVR